MAINRVAQISTSDLAGGAEKIAYDLYSAFSKRGLDSWLLVGRKQTREENIFPIKEDSGLDRLVLGHVTERDIQSKQLVYRYLLRVLSLNWPAMLRWMGLEDYYFPKSRTSIKALPERPDIIHFHNLHGDYFDLGFLPQLSAQYPLVLTLHDEWLYTGHCAHSIQCDRWKTGCGRCPDLERYPAIRHDLTALNWLRKKWVLNRTRLYLTAPSQWVMDRALSTFLHPERYRVIANGVDQTIFSPGDKGQARRFLNLPETDFILLFAAAQGKKNVYKDYETIEKALQYVNVDATRITFVALGGEENVVRRDGNLSVYSVPFQRDLRIVAEYYRSADLFLHAAKADTFPTTLLESLSCGTPVIATAVGGIPEQIEDGENGFLVPPGQPQAFADKINALIVNKSRISNMAGYAAIRAKYRFSLHRLVDEYLSFYQEVSQQWKQKKHRKLN